MIFGDASVDSVVRCNAMQCIYIYIYIHVHTVRPPKKTCVCVRMRKRALLDAIVPCTHSPARSKKLWRILEL